MAGFTADAYEENLELQLEEIEVLSAIMGEENVEYNLGSDFAKVRLNIIPHNVILVASISKLYPTLEGPKFDLNHAKKKLSAASIDIEKLSAEFQSIWKDADGNVVLLYGCIRWG